MNKPNHYPPEKPNAKKTNDKQFNEVVRFLKNKKCGVKGTSLPDYSNMITTYALVLWEIDPHYEKLRSRGKCFSDYARQFLNFNNPKWSLILKHEISELLIQLVSANIRVCCI